jgi:hypothetical protein
MKTAARPRWCAGATPFTEVVDSVARWLKTEPTPICQPGQLAFIESFTEVRMNEVVEAAVAGASLAAGAAIWLLAGYLIQRFAFRNPEPTYAIVFATSLTASMLLFSLLALLTFHIRYNYPGAASGLVQTVHWPHRGARRARLLTPRDAAEYITAVPKAEHDAADWQVAWSPRAIGRKRFRESRCCGPRQKRTAVSGRWRAHKKLARRDRKPLASETMPVGSDGQWRM